MEMRRYRVAVNAISPLAVTRISAEFFGGDAAADPALDPSRSSAVVAWLQSPESSWLTGQILRINGHQLSRITGFTDSAERYHAKDGVSLQFSEIGQAVSWLWGTQPRGLAGPLPTN
jgi:NAD(P)-dependent dehydrogenase (short-subunit alcohol dehydrogenase family)